jgi:hypothetical protein
MPNELAIRQPDYTLSELDTLATRFAKSLFFADAKDAAQALVKIQAGRELGLPPVYAMTKIFFVQGRITLSAEAMGALIKRSREYDYKVLTLDNTKAVIEFTHNGKVEYVSTFTMEDAKAAELIKDHGNWQKWPRPMLMSKALSQGARIVCPHIISGAYTPEDFGIETDDEGNITQPQRIEETATIIVEPPKQPAPEVRQVTQTAVDKAPDKTIDTKLETEQGIAFDAMKSASEQPAASTTAPDKAAERRTNAEAANKRVKEPRDPATVKTSNHLVNAVFTDFGLQPKEAYRILGINTINDLTIAPRDAYLTVAKEVASRTATKEEGK